MPKTTKCAQLSTDYLTAAGYESYSQYLRSKHWKAFRAENKGDSCFCCGSDSRLTLHHLTYDRLGAELPSDVETICSPCHTEIHRLVENEEVFLSWAHEYLKGRVAKNGWKPVKYRPRRRGPEQSLVGRRFGKKLVVLSYLRPPGGTEGSHWLCRCDCGRRSDVSSIALRRREEFVSPRCITKKLVCPPYPAVWTKRRRKNTFPADQNDWKPW